MPRPTNIGLRRATGPVAILLDTSVEPTGDIVTPLVRGARRPDGGGRRRVGDRVGATCARSRTRRPATSTPSRATCQAFRRADYAARGPLDERFRFYRNLDIWWSLVLRDEGEGSAPRRAVSLDGLPVVRHEHRGYTSLPDDERDRQSKRNFYRIIDRFGSRRDLLVIRPADAPALEPAAGAIRRARSADRSERPPSRGAASSARSASARAQSRAARAASRVGDEGGDLGGHGAVGGLRRRPDAVEVEAEDDVGIEDEPAPLVGGERRPQDLAQEGERDRHVEVVVDGRDEPVVERPAVGRQRGGGSVARSVDRERRRRRRP